MRMLLQYSWTWWATPNCKICSTQHPGCFSKLAFQPIVMLTPSTPTMRHNNTNKLAGQQAKPTSTVCNNPLATQALQHSSSLTSGRACCFSHLLALLTHHSSQHTNHHQPPPTTKAASCPAASNSFSPACSSSHYNCETQPSIWVAF